MDISRSRLKLCMVSSSGGHYEQLRMLATLGQWHRLLWVTEKTDYNSPADYYLYQCGLKDRYYLFKMVANSISSLRIWLKEKPDVVITTGTMVALPLCLIAKLLGKRLIYIETFARVYDGTRTGKLLYRFSDLFIYQWEGLVKVYPKGIYGGSIY